MNKKTHFLLCLMLLAAGLVTGTRAYTWEATIHAEGDTPDNGSESQVNIGIAIVAEKFTAETPSDYSVKVDLIDINDNAWLSKDIREFGNAEYMWKLRVDTDGPSPSTTPYIWWQDNEFGSGKFEMKSGNDGTGPVVVGDMKTTTSRSVPDNSVTEFTIHKTPEDCGGAYSLPQGFWQLIALPCEPDPGADTVADLFGDNFPGNYNETWVLYERDETNDEYTPLDNEWSLSQGQGYWIYNDEEIEVSLDMTGDPTVPNTSFCSVVDCFEIPLTVPQTSDTRLFNMKGNPFPYEVKWVDVKIMVDGDFDNLLIPSAAQAGNYLSNIIYKWNGIDYDSYDDFTPGMLGVLGPYDGFWVEVLEDAFLKEISLLIPAGINSFSSLNLNNNNELQFAATNDAWLERWYNWLLPQANAASSKSNKKELSGLAKRDAHKKAHEKAIKDNEEWYVRLIVEAPKEGLLVKNNVFGQLSDSKKGYDLHDLKELAPFGEKYLTIVFPHPDWGDKANDYASDFHSLNSRKGKDQWSFEVRTNDPARELTLSWSGPEDILNHSQLIDKETLEVIEIKPGESYTFVINDISRNFVWKYSAKLKKSKKSKKNNRF